VQALGDKFACAAATLRTMYPSLVPATDADLDFCQTLSQRNMAAYRARRGIAWDRERFALSWVKFENFIIVQNAQRVGLLRLLELDDALDIRDVQILPTLQRRGIGSWALRQAEAMAQQRDLAKLSLRVFAENPAKRLYRRFGFVQHERIGDTLHMLKHVMHEKP
jgi:ribosomal protein S18 acetylase RimI-like enzyme